MEPEWDDRMLCPDGGCVGLIGADGTCRVCGRAAPNWGDERRRGLVDAASDADVDLRPGGPDGPDGDAREAADRGEAALIPVGDRGGEWDDRRLCSNGACIGVIGDDGRCTVCGSAAA